MTEPWLFRVASHPSQGGGHVARSGVLARELARSAPVRMVLDANSPDARARLEAAGLSCVTAGEEGPGPWVGAVVDGYLFREAEAGKIARRARPMVWIDDFLDPPDGVDMLVNGACHLSDTEAAGVPALLGPRYALIDPRYAALPGRDRAAPVERVLVTFGRLDLGNATGLVLQALRSLPSLFSVTVVLDGASPHRGSVSDELAAFGSRGRLVVDAADMAPLLQDAGLVIGAGGVSLLERMAAGVPSVTLRIAENQRLFIEGAAKLGATLDAGDASGMRPAMLAGLIEGLLGDGGRRAAMSAAARITIDGQGAKRVASALLAWASQWRHERSVSVR